MKVAGDIGGFRGSECEDDVSSEMWRCAIWCTLTRVRKERLSGFAMGGVWCLRGTAFANEVIVHPPYAN